MNDLLGEPIEKPQRPRNEHWDAVCEACYGAAINSKTNRGVISRAVSDLKDMGANAFSIRKVAIEWKRANRDDAVRYLTPVTLVKCYHRYREAIERPKTTQGMDYDQIQERKGQHLAQLRLHGWPH